VTFSIKGFPSGATGTQFLSPGTGSGSSPCRKNTFEFGHRGPYTMTITATSGNRATKSKCTLAVADSRYAASPKQSDCESRSKTTYTRDGERSGDTSLPRSEFKRLADYPSATSAKFKPEVRRGVQAIQP